MLVLKNHFNGNDTLVHKGYVMNGCQFFSIENSKEVLIKHNVPEKVWDQVLNAIKDSSVNIDLDASIDIAEFAYLYCKNIASDPDMRQVIIDAKDAYYAYCYCRDVSNDPDMRQVIIDAKNPRYAYLYCRDVSNDPNMKQIVIDDESAVNL